MINQLENILESVPNLEKENAEHIKKPLLIIDDNKEVLDALSVILSGDYELVISDSYQQAIKKINPGIHVVLLDIKMTYKNGIETFSLLKAHYPYLKIIFHSAYPGNEEQALIADSLPHSGYLTKGDYDITELLKTLERAFLE